MALTPERRRERLTGLGGSDAAAALGLSPWKTPYKLWREKRGLDQDDTAEGEALEWGNLLESVVADKWMRASGLKVQRINNMLRHPIHTYMIANIDRAVVNPNIAGRVFWNGRRLSTDTILEVKTSLSGWMDDKWGDENTDQIPLWILLQTMHYLVVTGVEICYVGLLQAGPKFRRYTTRRDPEVIDMMVDQEGAFWRMVENGTPPEANTVEDVRLRHPQHVEGLHVEATQEVAHSFIKFVAAKHDENKGAAAAKPHALAIMKFLGDADTLTIQGVPVLTWRASKEGEAIDEDRLRQQAPGIYEQYLKHVPGSRRLYIKPNKEGKT